MELQAPIPFPFAANAAEEHALEEIDVAIALVTGGVAARVRIAALEAGVADRVAGVAAARSWGAGLHFHLDRSPDCATFTVGPVA
jgi:hypothetical protein